MIDTREFIKSIYLEGNKVKVRDGTTVSGISFEELANILEFGRRDKGFRGFPVWRKTLEEFQKDIPKILKNFK